jgi:hypothetical protein
MATGIGSFIIVGYKNHSVKLTISSSSEINECMPLHLQIRKLFHGIALSQKKSLVKLGDLG